MSNLKKILALSLVFVMTFALVGTAGAVSINDYADKADIKFQDEVQMLAELQIMQGKGTGFDPAGTLTRAELCKMSYVANNRGVNDNAVNYVGLESSVPFADVRGADWFSGYVYWAFGKNLVVGKSTTAFKPNDQLTGYEALKVMLVMLGHDPVKQGYNKGAGWELSVMADAQDAGLLVGTDSLDLSKPLPRDYAAKIIHNMLFAEMVTYNDVSGVIVRGNQGKFAAIKLDLEEVEGIVIGNEYSYVSVYNSHPATAVIVDGARQDPGKTQILITSGTSSTTRAPVQADKSPSFPIGSALSDLGKRVKLYAKVSTSDILSVYGGMNVGTGNRVYEKTAGTDGYTKLLSDEDLSITNAQFSINYKSIPQTYAIGAVKLVAAASTEGATAVNTDVVAADKAFEHVMNGGSIYTVSGSTSTLAFSAKTGNLVTVICNNNDKKVTNVIATDVSVTKVTKVSGEKVTFSGGGVTGEKKPEDYFGLSGLAVGNKVIITNLNDGKYLATKLDAVESAATTVQSAGAKVVIGGTSYEKSDINGSFTNVFDGVSFAELVDSTQGYMRKTEKFFFYNGRLIGFDKVDDPTASSGNYCAVGLFEMTGIRDTAPAPKLEVSVVYADGTKADKVSVKSVTIKKARTFNTFTATFAKGQKYTIADVEGLDTLFGTDITSNTTNPSTGKTLSDYASGGNLNVAFANYLFGKSLTGSDAIDYYNNVASYTKESDGSINLVFEDVTVTGVTSYKDNDLGGKIVDSNTVVFLLEGKDWSTYKGIGAIPELTVTDVNSILGKKTIDNDSVKAAVIKGTKADSDWKYAVAMTDYSIAPTEGSSDPVGAFDIYNGGTEWIPVTTDKSVKLGGSTTSTTLTSLTDLGFEAGDVIAYKGSTDKITELKKVSTTAPTGPGLVQVTVNSEVVGYLVDGSLTNGVFMYYTNSSDDRFSPLMFADSAKLFVIDMDASDDKAVSYSGSAINDNLDPCDLEDIETAKYQHIAIVDKDGKVSQLYQFASDRDR